MLICLIILPLWTTLVSDGIGKQVVFWVVTKVIYNAYFHPLSRFPGPFLNRATRLAYIYQVLGGNIHHSVLAMHQKYGDIVRLAPDELSFSHPDAWEQIMGHKKADQEEMGKAPWFYRTFKYEALSIINEDRKPHARLRRPMSHGFSEQSLRDQGPVIRGYVDLFCQRLREASAKSQLVVLSDWLSYVAFDIVGDLSFGEPFGCLKEGKEDEWLTSMANLGTTGVIFQCLGFFPWIKEPLVMIFAKTMRKYRDAHLSSSTEKMRRRIEFKGERPDFIQGLLQKREQLVSHILFSLIPHMCARLTATLSDRTYAWRISSPMLNFSSVLVPKAQRHCLWAWHISFSNTIMFMKSSLTRFIRPSTMWTRSPSLVWVNSRT